jgi:DNA-binding GntR family transcriptional regulator
VVTECTGIDPGRVREVLATEAESGLLEDLGGQFMLSEDGTRAVLEGYEERYAALRENSEVEDWYQRFETLNSQFLQTISAWQTSGQDEGVLDRLLKIITRQVRALASITGTVPRYARYASRFERSLELVEAGKSEFISSPTADSLHNIWFEFHEDILTLLGRPRLDAESDH